MATIVAACATFPGPPGGTAQPGPGGRNPAAASTVSATALGRNLLARAHLPPGAQPARGKALPQPLRTPVSMPAAAGLVDVHRVFSLRQPMSASYAFLLAHPPGRMRQAGSGQGGGLTGTTMEELTYLPRRLPAGAYQAVLVIAVRPATRGSWLREDAQIISFPSRSPSEYLGPARYHVVIISASRANQRPHTLTRAITSRDVITRLADLLNGLPAAPHLTFGCPAMVASYQVAFATSAKTRPVVVATAMGCATDGIWVDGKTKPALWDPREKLAAAVKGLMLRA